MHRVVIGVQSHDNSNTPHAMYETCSMLKNLMPQKTATRRHTVSNVEIGTEECYRLYEIIFKSDRAYNSWMMGKSDGWWYNGVSLNGTIGVFYWDFEIPATRIGTTFSHTDTKAGLSVFAKEMMGRPTDVVMMGPVLTVYH